MCKNSEVAAMKMIGDIIKKVSVKVLKGEFLNLMSISKPIFITYPKTFLECIA